MMYLQEICVYQTIRSITMIYEHLRGISRRERWRVGDVGLMNTQAQFGTIPCSRHRLGHGPWVDPEWTPKVESIVYFMERYDNVPKVSTLVEEMKAFNNGLLSRLHSS